MKLRTWFVTILFSIVAMDPVMPTAGILLPTSFVKHEDNPADRRKSVGVFVAGVEGTLHHFWSYVFTSCVKMGKCKFVSEGYREIMWFQRNNQPLLDAGWALQDFNNHTTLYLNSICLGLFNTKLCTPQLSYPNGFIANDYPALNHYAHAASTNGDQMKVIVTLRDADATLASVQRRFFRTADWEINGANVLLMQLMEFNKSFPDSWKCIDTDFLPALAQQVDTFLTDPQTGEHNFDFKKAIQYLYTESQENACTEARCHNKKFRKAMHKIRKFCGANLLSGRVRSAEQAQGFLDFIFN